MRKQELIAVSLVKQNNMNDPKETSETTFVLPIVCTHCGEEIELSMDFALLAPKKEEIINTKKDDHIEITEA